MVDDGGCKHYLRLWILLMTPLLYYRSLYMFKERNGPRSGSNVGKFKVVKLDNGESRGLRVMSEALRLQADKGAPNATHKARRSSAALALLVLSEVL